MAKKKRKTEPRKPYVTDEQIRTILDRGWAKLRAQQEAVAKAPDPRAAPES